MAGDTVGISGGGQDAEARFFVLTGAAPAPKAALGDAVLDGNVVEIKQAKSATLNQVRAVKFIVLVAYFCPAERSPRWYVVPPHRVVALVASKLRGQHTENPFESATLSIMNLGPYELDEESELRERVLSAAEEGRAYGDLHDEMNRILEESKALAEQARMRVSECLAGYGLA